MLRPYLPAPLVMLALLILSPAAAVAHPSTAEHLHDTGTLWWALHGAYNMLTDPVALIVIAVIVAIVGTVAGAVALIRRRRVAAT